MPDFYGTIEGADDYLAGRGRDEWSDQEDDVKIAALRRASTYIDALGRQRLETGGFVTLFPGRRVNGRAQELEWPRTGAVDYAGDAIDPATVPIEVERATYEAAVREVVAPGGLRPDYVPGKTVKSEKVGVSGIETEFAITAGEVNLAAPVVSLILDILAPVLGVAAAAEAGGSAIWVV